ncbi:hypothetical protein ACLESO_39425 [Pyxidicoccus sp. 3LG]
MDWKKWIRSVPALGMLGLVACGSPTVEPAAVESAPAPLVDCEQPLPETLQSTGPSGDTHAQLAVTAVVTPILLVPQGSSVTAQQVTTLTQALGNVRRWYQRELPNKNVRWEPLVTMAGDQTAAHYLTNNNVWAEMPGEIQTKLGWNPWTYTGTTHHIALVIGRDLLGWAGGNGYNDGRGLAILGLESLVEQSKCAGEWWCTQEFWHGTVAHELGHGFTLPHDSDPASIMNFHGDYTNKHFTGTAPATVEASPATQAKQENWSFCGIDYQCATKRCGGNWSGDRLWCLPSALYPKEAAGIPAGYTCRTTSQCATGSCQMNANGDKVCSSGLQPQYVTPFFPDVP